jgi:hypothetical protein
MELLHQDITDIVFVQEPPIIQNKPAGITRSHRTYITNEDKSRAAIIIVNINIDALLIKQRCDRNATVIEVGYKSKKILAANMYFDITEDMNIKLAKVDEILKFGTGTGILIAMDSNSRSQAWHDKQTNIRDRTLEEYLISRDLNIMNEESDLTTYQSRRVRSNIDITVINNRILKNFKDWVLSMEDSCSDRNIIKFNIGQNNKYGTKYNYTRTSYITTEEHYTRFDYNLQEANIKEFRMEYNEEIETLDSILAKHIKEADDTENTVEKYQIVITNSCKKSFKIRQNTNKTTKQKSVPWWTPELTIKRKRLNALRRLYQRTKTTKN